MTATTAPRKITPRWEVGEAVVVNKTRWIIRALNYTTGRVALASSNTTNHAIWWSTTIDALPRKAAA